MFVTVVYSETRAHPTRHRGARIYSLQYDECTYMLSPYMLFLSRARRAQRALFIHYPPTVGGSHMPRDTYLGGHVSKKWLSCWPIFRIKIFKCNTSALFPPVQHELKTPTQMQNTGRHAGWRGQEGFSHAGSAVAALDSTERLSRCN